MQYEHDYGFRNHIFLYTERSIILDVICCLNKNDKLGAEFPVHLGELLGHNFLRLLVVIA
jgi:hypothetical protein